jgi:hypothetical protein
MTLVEKLIRMANEKMVERPNGCEMKEKKTLTLFIQVCLSLRFI